MMGEFGGMLIFCIVVGGVIGIFQSISKEGETKNQQKRFDELLDELRKNHLDTSVHSRLLTFVRSSKHLNATHSQMVYAHALTILEENPSDVRAKTFALDAGRWHYGMQRSDKKLTIYDEQALQNDILVRSSGQMPST